MIRRYCLAVALAASVAFAANGEVLASQTLTLTLESPSLSSDESNKSTSQVSQPSNDQHSAPQSTKANSVPNSDTVKVGRVGVVQSASAAIYKSRSTSSSRYARVKSQTPLAIVREEGDWYGILMSNGCIGWVQQKCVKLIGFDLVADKSELSRTSFSSRSGDVSRQDAVASDLMSLPDRFVGTPYVYGGTDPASGMDCSAFVRMVFNSSDIHLPRTAREQANVGETVPLDQLQPGDRLYFRCKNSYIDHCGIYCGNGYFVHCSKTRNGVGIDTLTSDYYWRHLVIAKRS